MEERLLWQNELQVVFVRNVVTSEITLGQYTVLEENFYFMPITVTDYYLIWIMRLNDNHIHLY